MKKTNKPKPKAIKELAGQFEQDLKNSLPIAIQPNGSIAYKDYYIKTTLEGNWVLYSKHSKIALEQYFLKTCALMAAKAYSRADITKFIEIKQLDNRYWASYSDNQVYRKNIKTAKDFNRYLVLLNKLEYSQERSDYFQEKISKMFKWSFA